MTHDEQKKKKQEAKEEPAEFYGCRSLGFVGVGDIVDVWENHAWWMGKCTAVNTRTDKYTVVNETDKKKMKYERDDVRINQLWFPAGSSRFWCYTNNEETTEQFARVIDAYTTLPKPLLRAIYINKIAIIQIRQHQPRSDLCCYAPESTDRVRSSSPMHPNPSLRGHGRTGSEDMAGCCRDSNTRPQPLLASTRVASTS
ncbi:hypothetical protein LXL04_017479 [Taraxacum kok-saghyz]